MKTPRWFRDMLSEAESAITMAVEFEMGGGDKSYPGTARYRLEQAQAFYRLNADTLPSPGAGTLRRRACLLLAAAHVVVSRVEGQPLTPGLGGDAQCFLQRLDGRLFGAPRSSVDVN